VRKILMALLILSFTFVTSRLLVGMVQQYSARLAPELAPATAGVTQTIVQWIVVLVGVLVLLSTLGIAVAPLLGALGVGGLAVGLALQPTLSNAFAGFQIAVARQIRPGHRVRLSSGEEGYVTDIQWRTTTLRTPTNHLIIIPNSRLAESIVTNYEMPDRPVNIVIQVGVGYDSDTRQVETALHDEALELIRSHDEFVADFDPIVRFQSYGESSLNFLVILRIQSYDDQFAVWGEIHHRIFERLRDEGIEIPFPMRTVLLRTEMDDHPGGRGGAAGPGARPGRPEGGAG
jgi:small-conductance mechanosensitive channel